MITTVNKYLLNSTRPAVLLLLKWADLAAKNGGSFTIEEKYAGDWLTTVTINWPGNMNIKDFEKELNRENL